MLHAGKEQFHGGGKLIAGDVVGIQHRFRQHAVFPAHLVEIGDRHVDAVLIGHLDHLADVEPVYSHPGGAIQGGYRIETQPEAVGNAAHGVAAPHPVLLDVENHGRHVQAAAVAACLGRRALRRLRSRLVQGIDRDSL